MQLRALAVLVVAASLVIACGSSGGGGNPAQNVAETKTRGYVVSSFSYMFPEHDEDPCPGGFTRGPLEMRLEDGFVAPDDCQDPESVSDPEFKTLDGPGRLNGMDLDGIDSSKSSGGQCAHDDFTGMSGESGIDYQYWRAVGCVRGLQSDEIARDVTEEAVVNGSMTILLDFEDIDNEENDNEVRAQVFGSTDLPAIGSDGNILPFATLSVHEDKEYHGEIGTGEIVDGVLVVGPMDIFLRLNIQIVDANQSVLNGYLRMEFLEDGTVDGQIFGYQPIEEAYEIFGRQAGAAGAAAMSYTCTGMWEALKSHADGDYDPETGACTSISIAYRFKAVPAFVAK